MNRRIIQHFLLLLFLCLMNYEGVRGTKILNKPPIKTIKTEYGDVYDCVDFYDQPAFDHPLLKNHNYHPQMKPSLLTKESIPTPSRSATLQQMELSDEGCPVGTVPLRRYTKEDVIRQKLLPPPEGTVRVVDPPLANRDNFNDSKSRRIKPLKGYKLAIVSTEDNPNNKFGGASMIAAIYNPRSTGQQHSACRLKLIKGKNIIQTGWRVDPTLYGDNKTRLFIHFDDGTNSCFDLLCPSFVIVNQQITLGQPFNQTSSINGKLYDMAFQIKWDQEKGNWWLLIDNVAIGFWPKEVFDDFENFATTVEWGGVVYSPAGVLEPPMGSGLYPLMRSTAVNAYCRVITLLNDKGQNIDLLGSKLPTFSTTSMLYVAVDVPNYPGVDYNHTILYGGPGEI
ncbi:hypothetical protein EJD97_008356 [Solanum chilense]|uniref:Neprosin PEP catalytic domain-containing protein n=1 Tax=Solanum chilense TaxID=4083 RepID=A0A6N2BS61_SOLCI|nr:hypothetical protein EJD97_008356 [Solanum chilense]